MKDEIKEILDKIEKVANKETASYNGLIETTNEQYKQLLDYITNLQQQYDGAILVGKELNKENKRLRTQLNAYENPDDLTLFYMWLDEKAKYKMKKLQQRIDKAIEYINLYAGIDNNYCLDYHDLNPLLNILKGDDENEKRK